MEAQRHGNVSVMETSLRTKRISFKRFLLALFLMGCVAVAFLYLAIIALYHESRTDTNGNLPHDVVRNFIELTEAADYKTARELWYGGSERVTPMKFEDFCERYKRVGLRNFKISTARRSKADFSTVRVEWEENGEKKHVFFGLKLRGDTWKLHRGHCW